LSDILFNYWTISPIRQVVHSPKGLNHELYTDLSTMSTGIMSTYPQL